MTTDKTPSDAAIEELARPFIRSVGSYWENDDAIPDNGSIEDFARAVLAKWGQPSGAGEVVAVPLTDEQIAEMMRDTWGCASIAPRHALEFARAVERAHGIKGGQHGAE